MLREPGVPADTGTRICPATATHRAGARRPIVAARFAPAGDRALQGSAQPRCAADCDQKTQASQIVAALRWPARGLLLDAARQLPALRAHQLPATRPARDCWRGCKRDCRLSFWLIR